MSLDQRGDPLLAFNFQVSLMEAGRGKTGALTTVTLSSIGLSKVAGFSECTGLEGTLEAHDYQAGGINGCAFRPVSSGATWYSSAGWAKT